MKQVDTSANVKHQANKALGGIGDHDMINLFAGDMNCTDFKLLLLPLDLTVFIEDVFELI